MRCVLKFSVAQVMPQAGRDSRVGFRSAIRFMNAVESTCYVLLRRPIDIVSYHQIKFAIAIIVNPSGAGGKLIDAPQTSLFGHISERSVVVVMKQMALAHRGNKDIVKTIVI